MILILVFWIKNKGKNLDIEDEEGEDASKDI